MLNKKLEKVLKYLYKNKSAKDNTLTFRKNTIPLKMTYDEFIGYVELLSNGNYINLDNKNKKNIESDYPIKITLLEKGASYSRNIQGIMINRVISIMALVASIFSIFINIFI